MKNYPIFILSNLIFFLIIGISIKSYAITSPSNDSTNILLLSNESRLRQLLDIQFHTVEAGDDVMIKTSDKTKIKGIITKIKKDKIHIQTKNEITQIIDIQDIKTIKRYKETHPFWGGISLGFGALLCLLCFIGLLLMISSYANLDTGGNFFPILGSTSFIALLGYIGYRFLKLSEKRGSPIRKFKIGKKWKAKVVDLSNTRSYREIE